MTPQSPLNQACAASGYRADCPKRAFKSPIPNATYNVNLSTEALNGVWKLRVNDNDNANADTGYIDAWSITF